MKYLPQIIELADGTKCVYLEDFRRECDEAREAIRALAEHGESEIQRITKERDEVQEQRDCLHNLHNKNAIRSKELLDLCGTLRKERDEAIIKYTGEANEFERQRNHALAECEKARRERDELQEKYDTLAVENMLEVNKICKQRDAAIKELKEAWLAMDEIEGTDRINKWQNKNAHVLGKA